MKAIDKIDVGILRELQRDNRISNTKLAELFNLSEASCWRRVKRLEESGVIEGFHAVLDRRKLGFGVTVFVQIKVADHSQETTAEIERILQASPNVLACDNTTGEADFLLEVVAEDLEDYSGFVENILRKLPGLLNIRSNISLRQVKANQPLPIT
jgi:DNA-binding Lrp family transcriptional regulator